MTSSSSSASFIVHLNNLKDNNQLFLFAVLQLKGSEAGGGGTAMTVIKIPKENLKATVASLQFNKTLWRGKKNTGNSPPPPQKKAAGPRP